MKKLVEKRKMKFKDFLKELASGWGWREPSTPRRAAVLLMKAFHPPEDGLGEKEVEVEYYRGGYRDEDRMTYYYEYEWRVRGIPLPERVEDGSLFIAPLYEGVEKVGFRIYYKY